MKESEIRNNYLKKINELKKHNKLYFEDSSPLISDKDYDKIKKDILNLEKKFSYLKNASSPSISLGFTPSKNFIKSNILGVFNLLEQIRKYKKKFNKDLKLIHVSTDEVYGDIGKNLRSSEKSPYRPSSPYSASKASADHLIKSYARTYGLNIMI